MKEEEKEERRRGRRKGKEEKRQWIELSVPSAQDSQILNSLQAVLLFLTLVTSSTCF